MLKRVESKCHPLKVFPSDALTPFSRFKFVELCEKTTILEERLPEEGKEHNHEFLMQTLQQLFGFVHCALIKHHVEDFQSLKVKMFPAQSHLPALEHLHNHQYLLFC